MILFNACPICGSDDLEGGPISIEGNYAIQEMDCVICEATWMDHYVANHREDIERGEPLSLRGILINFAADLGERYETGMDARNVDSLVELYLDRLNAVAERREA